MNLLLHRFRCVSVLLALLSSVAAAAPPLYRAERLPGLSPDGTPGSAALFYQWLSDAGEVVYQVPMTGRLAVWSGGRLRELPPLGLDPEGNRDTVLTGINAAGTAIGLASIHRGHTYLGSRAVLWPSTGGIIEIGLFGTDATGYGSSYPSAINDSGVVAGGSEVFTREGRSLGRRGFLWRQGQLLQLPPLSIPGYIQEGSFALALDSAGRAVGYSSLRSGEVTLTRATLWTPEGHPIDLGSLYDRPGSPGSSSAVAINERGEVIGASSPTVAEAEQEAARRLSRPTMWSAGRIIDLGSIDAPPRGNLQGPFGSGAYDLNNLGEALVSMDPPSPHLMQDAALWRAGRLHHLRPPSPAGPQAYAWALDLDDQGIVVGDGENQPGASGRRALVARDGVTFMDLNELVRPGDLQGWTLIAAEQINRRGQILAHGEDREYRQALFVLTPLD
ncbi:hypothetical protein OOT46_25955 [Aquabacterium sp. A7-Y]|uniref:hypothetical protein n=1 Tax=Aquabacterium sp. A7-Y TaxID=1349605 RepID=UPI00223E3153|nr:hypothetical protein [Aquabacterium sp. A7-Y]MCW7541260.1 hypothetical protein [Aquabacterium sp. A7-Y]